MLSLVLILEFEVDPDEVLLLDLRGVVDNVLVVEEVTLDTHVRRRLADWVDDSGLGVGVVGLRAGTGRSDACTEKHKNQLFFKHPSYMKKHCY